MKIKLSSIFENSVNAFKPFYCSADIYGDVTGDVTGNLIGNVTGNVTVC